MTAGEGGESSFGLRRRQAAHGRPADGGARRDRRPADRGRSVRLGGAGVKRTAWSDIDLFVVHCGDRETVSEAFLHAKLRLRDQTASGRADGARGADRPGRGLPLGGGAGRHAVADARHDATTGSSCSIHAGVLGRKLRRASERGLRNWAPAVSSWTTAPWYWDLQARSAPRRGRHSVTAGRVSNHERGRKLMAAALEYLGEMDAAISPADRGTSPVRHAQEVVELVMKAVLGYLCIDYPKVHDTADVFIAALGRRQMGLSDDEARRRAGGLFPAGRETSAGVLLRIRRRLRRWHAPRQRTRGVSTVCAQRLIAAIEEQRRQSESDASADE